MKKEISAALAWKRSVASSPTTPNEVRWLTATRYAKTPTIQISQARGEVTPPLCPADRKNSIYSPGSLRAR